MKRLTWVVIALCICAWGTPSPADTGVGYSNTFGINNTAGDTRVKPPSSTADSPYSDTEGKPLLRGQLHSHSRTDINKIPRSISQEDLAELYRDEGFNFVALTNHDYLCDLSEHLGALDPPTPSVIWAAHSTELTPTVPWELGHVLAIGCMDDTTDNMLWEGVTRLLPNDLHVWLRLQNVKSRGGLALVAHPDDPTVGVSANDLNTLYRIGNDKPDGIAIYASGGRGHYADGTWENLLERGHKVWGFAEEDYHPYQKYVIGKAWVGVPGYTSDAWSTVEDNLRNGNYYSYWVQDGRWPGDFGDPPVLRVTKNETGDHPLITATVLDAGGSPCPVDKISFITSYGRESTPPGPPYHSSFSLECNGTEKYVRVEVENQYVGGAVGGGMLHIASQPIIINPAGDAGPMSSLGPSILLSSPELHLRYLGGEERPSPPDAGYIGHAFDVTTESGTCPPGATLDLSHDGEDLSAIGGTHYLAIYRYDTSIPKWAKIGGTVDAGTATISSPITALGFYTISADLLGDTTAPEVFIDNPPDGGIVNMDTEVKATVNDDLGAYTVSFYMNDHPLAEDADALDGWSVNLPIADYCEGDWMLKAVAEDLAGNQGTAEIPIYVHSSTARPTASITSPGDGANLSGTMTATGTCGDDIAVASVSLYADDTAIGYGELDGSGGWSSDIDTRLLVNGVRSLKAVVEDYPGNEASASVSVTINNATVSVAGAKAIVDGGPAGITGLVTTAGTAEIGGAFYTEDADRFAGLRVSTDKTIAQGDMVSASGTMSTVEGERVLLSSDLAKASSGNPVPPPLAMQGRFIGGGALGLQGGVVDCVNPLWYRHKYSGAMNNIGLLIATWGRVTGKGDGYLYVDDGAALMDGTLTGQDANIGIRVICDPTGYSTGDFLIVTGISSCFETPSGEIARRILTRKPEDVRKVYP